MNWIVPLGSACDTTGDITEKKRERDRSNFASMLSK